MSPRSSEQTLKAFVEAVEIDNAPRALPISYRCETHYEVVVAIEIRIPTHGASKGCWPIYSLEPLQEHPH